MLNIISNNIYINKVSHIPLGVSFRCSLKNDTFEKRTPIDNKRLIDMSEQNFKQTDKNTDVAELASSLKGKISTFPPVLQAVLAVIPTYLNQKIDADTFSEVYQTRMPGLYTRIEYGTDKDVFASDFKQEISMLKTFDSVVAKYRNKDINKQEFDSTLEGAVRNYLENFEEKQAYYLE